MRQRYLEADWLSVAESEPFSGNSYSGPPTQILGAYAPAPWRLHELLLSSGSAATTFGCTDARRVTGRQPLLHT